MVAAYYNECDPFAAAWLRELIKAGHIASGEVDERSIEDVLPSDLRGFTQCHFFAGIGVWSYALRQAGWPDDREVWTGSCPCQPFSAAGKRKGTADERHLWPAWFHLIAERKPSVVFGEQVDAAIRQGWLDLVQSDMEGIGYAFGAQGLAACSVGAPHQRKRLYFVGESNSTRLSERERNRRVQPQALGSSERQAVISTGDAGNLAVSDEQQRHGSGNTGQAGREESTNRGFWSGCDWLYYRDEKFRPVEPGTFPLAHGATARVGRLRGYGNAIVAPVAQAFIESFMESQWTRTAHSV